MKTGLTLFALCAALILTGCKDDDATPTKNDATTDDATTGGTEDATTGGTDTDDATTGDDTTETTRDDTTEITGDDTTETTGEEACTAPEPCSQLNLDDFATTGGDIDEYTETQTCVLETLRDRQPAELFAKNDFGDSNSTVRARIAPSDVVYLMAGGFNNGDPMPYVDTPEKCTLKPAEWFQGCLDAVDSACLYPDVWATDCADAPDYCPNP